MDDRQPSAQPTKGWDGYWEATRVDGQPPLWDCAPSGGSGEDLERFMGAMNQDLPLIDVGCGNGTQTFHLAQRMDHVVGVDVSRTAVELARQRRRGSSPEFEQLDMLDRRAVGELHRRLGDANVYMRGVLHQVESWRRPEFVFSIAELLGGTGVCYMNELTPESLPVLRDLSEESSAGAALGRVAAYGIEPGIVTGEEVAELFRARGLHILETSEASIRTAVFEDSAAKSTEIPARGFIVGR